ncbi:hypothetical protein MRB53_006645 [Persea americana]|uniref:Uncharacterized protein n=1 Tax=Persea americana TaxID=3435 RepID=A0ACC2MID1_PERAE|nr:hypothetical protein MRB53_006645 [Persea americana]
MVGNRAWLQSAERNRDFDSCCRPRSEFPDAMRCCGRGPDPQRCCCRRRTSMTAAACYYLSCCKNRKQSLQKPETERRSVLLGNVD